MMSFGVWLFNTLKDVILPILIFVVLPLILWYLRDRRKSRAEATVAERTVGSEVTLKDTGALGASVAFVQEAFRVERESKDREIDGLKVKVAALELAEIEKDRKIRQLEQTLEEKESVITDLRRNVANLTTRLERLESASG